MLFNSINFLVFFTLVISVYQLVREDNRWIILLISSYVFYMGWNPAFIVLIIISTITDYWTGIKIYETKQKRYLVISLVVNLGLLFFFKYFNFFLDSIHALLDYFGILYGNPKWDIVLPVGISFYTFQTISYSIDINRGKFSPERHFGKFALFVSFFPQLVAGPIERASNLMPQIKKLSWIKKEVVEIALFQIVWGLFLKLVVGDNIAVVVDALYSNFEDLNGMRLLLPSFLFSFQIYSDFAGYSLIAIGISKFFGIKLMDNFRTPYFSKSVTEFWSRWHISLSSWFKDYLYIPLGGNKISLPRTYINILIVFLISGFWHGANWTFVFWGGFHGLILVIERLIGFNRIASKNCFLKFLRYAITFILVCFGWILFRANSIHEAFNVLEKIPQGLLTDIRDCLWLIKAFIMGQNDGGIHFFSRWIELELSPNAIPNSEFIFVSIFLGLLLMLVFEFFSRKKSVEILFQGFSFSGKLTVFTVVILMIAFFGQYQSDNQFIYFQF